MYQQCVKNLKSAFEKIFFKVGFFFKNFNLNKRCKIEIQKIMKKRSPSSSTVSNKIGLRCYGLHRTHPSA